MLIHFGLQGGFAMEDSRTEPDYVPRNDAASVGAGRRVRVGYSRGHKCGHCKVEGGPKRLRLRVGGVDVEAIFGGEFRAPGATFRPGTPVAKDGSAAPPLDDDATKPGRQYPPTDFLDAAA